MKGDDCRYCGWEDGKSCESRSDGGTGFCCTHEMGHRGSHVACGIGCHEIASWPNEAGLDLDEIERQYVYWSEVYTDHGGAVRLADRVPALIARVGELQGRVRELEAEVARLRTTASCAFCGFEIAVDDDAASAAVVAEHVVTCEKHPLGRRVRELEAELLEGADLYAVQTKQLQDAVKQIEQLGAVILVLRGTQSTHEVATLAERQRCLKAIDDNCLTFGEVGVCDAIRRAIEQGGAE